MRPTPVPSPYLSLRLQVSTPSSLPRQVHVAMQQTLQIEQVPMERAHLPTSLGPPHSDGITIHSLAQLPSLQPGSHSHSHSVLGTLSGSG